MQCTAFITLRGMRFRRYYFTLPIHLGSNAICEVTINSRKFAIWTTNNGWCSVIQIFTKRYEVAFGLTTACCISRPVSVRHRCQNWLVMTAVTANMHTHVFDDTQYRHFDFSNITMPFFASISRAMSCGVVTTTAPVTGMFCASVN